MIHRHLSILAVVLSLLAFFPLHSTAAGQADTAYQQAEKGRKILEESAKIRKFRVKWVETINRYEKFAARYPKDERADDALFKAGDLYAWLYTYSSIRSDQDSSIEAYQKVARKYPGSPLADDALFKIGEIYLKRKNSEGAYLEFDKILRKYPKGNMAARASAMARELSVEKKEETVSQSAPSGTATVTKLRHWTNPAYTRIAINVDRKVAFRETFLKKLEDTTPPRLFLDISGARIAGDIQPIEINDGLLKMARAGQYDKETVRVVLDIQNIESYKIFALEDPFRIVVDVSGEKKEESIEQILARSDTTPQVEAPAVPPVPDTTPPPPSVHAKPTQGAPSLAQQLGLGIKKVVIDPGHGGDDPGAIGYGGIKEKDVVLDIGKKLRDIIRVELGVEVVMTRDRDIFIPLEERTAIANTSGGDLFISIHANASRNRKAGGIETYFLNFATDEESMLLAAKENSTSTKNISDLQAILNDLMLNSKVNESSKLARYVQGSLLETVNGKGRDYRDRGVKQAPFYVLIGAQMPSILVETSFITNKEEARKLASDGFQKDLARSIAEGVQKYSEIIKVASR